jgi:hypothetical protein
MSLTNEQVKRLEDILAPDEIEVLSRATRPDGTSQKEIDLETNTWQSIIEERYKMKLAFFDKEPGSSLEEYYNYIRNWYKRTVGSIDPWIWIDDFYYRQTKNSTSYKLIDAYNKIQALRNDLGYSEQ